MDPILLDQFRRDLGADVGIGRVVFVKQADHTAVDATRRVDFFDGEIHALLDVRAVGFDGPGLGNHRTDDDVLRAAGRRHDGGDSDKQRQAAKVAHGRLLNG